MAGDFLLDTNIVAALFNREPAVVTRLGAAPSVYVPAIVLGELFFGALNSSHVPENLQRIADFQADNRVVVADEGTAREYGSIKHDLKVKGRPIPENDIWIAAAARQHGLILVSRDAHFGVVNGLQSESW
jgi:tRNA(fMet)-specific endonuclease VapC